MTGDVSVVMAYRSFGDPHREAAFAYTRQWYADRFGWPITVDTSENGRAAAINAGVRAATGDVIVQVDPDALVEPAALTLAVDAARHRDGLVLPHNRYLYLHEIATARVLDEGADPFAMGPDDCHTDGSLTTGLVNVFRRSTWAAVGGYDERFRGWGGDDAAYSYACWAWFGDQTRIPGSAVHLWHERPVEEDPMSPAYNPYFGLVVQYRDAATIGPAAVRALVAAR